MPPLRLAFAAFATLALSSLPSSSRADVPQIVVTSAQTGPAIPANLFGAVVSFQDLGQGAVDPARVAAGKTGIDVFYSSYVQTLRDMGVKNIRWGDATPTATVTVWQRGIGPQSSRPLQRSREGSPPTSPAYGVDEFLQLAEALGAEANWVYPFSRGSAQDAANCLAYMTTPYDPSRPHSDPNDSNYWAAMRAQNGHPAPYACMTYFDVGNEEEMSAQGWRSGTTVSIGGGKTAVTGDTNGKQALYAFGGVTSFTKQPVVGFADMQTSASLSSGAASQEFYASYPPVFPGSDSLYVGSSGSTTGDTQWTRIADLKSAASTDQVYTLDTTSGKIVFGDGVHGAIPPAGKQIKLTYQSGPHEGFVDYYPALKKVNPSVQIIAQCSSDIFGSYMSAGNHCDGFANHAVGFTGGYTRTTSTFGTPDRLAWQQMNQVASYVQYDTLLGIQHSFDQAAGFHAPLYLTAYGHHRTLVPADDPEDLIRESDAMLQASAVIEYQRLGTKLAHIFLLNDKPYNPNPLEAPPPRRFQAALIGDGISPPYIYTPKGLAFQLMSDFSGKTQVGCSVQNNPQIVLASTAPRPAVDALHTMAAVDNDGMVYLAVVNQDLSNDVSANIVTPGFNHNDYATIRTLNGATINSINRLNASAEVTTTTTTTYVGPGGFNYVFPAHSVTMIKLLRSSSVAVPALTNLSARATVTSDSPLIAGFIVGGSGSKSVLVRGIGPTLSTFGVTGALAAPSLQLTNSTGKVLASNNGWGGNASLAATFAQVGAFPLPAGSADAAAAAAVPPGNYSLIISGPSSGTALAEIYDADADPVSSSSRLVNGSACGMTSAGQPLVVGFVIPGTAAKQVLIRAVGPTLAQFGVANAMAGTPILNVYGLNRTLAAQNQGWSTAPSATAIARASANVGAFAFAPNSADSAVLTTLSPGAYTAAATPAGNTSGVVLIEVYDVP